MKKRAGPSRKPELRPLAACQTCQGKGLLQGIFYSMPCDVCEGAGLVDGKTGETLDHLEVIMQLRIRLNQARRDIRWLQSQDTEDRGYGSRHDRGYGRFGKRYHGD